jgi:CRP-like cAMP-binding protein
MHELLFNRLSEVAALKREEWELCKRLFMPKKLRRRNYLLQEGNVCKYAVYIEKGLLRTYSVNQKNNEHILQFGSEGSWIADLSSFFSGEPSWLNIDSLEDSELLLITKPSLDLLLDSIPRLERFFRMMVQNNLIQTQKRLIGSFNDTAEEKYGKFIRFYGDYSHRVPQHMIAAYLGMSRETLSRLRRQMKKDE